MDDCTIHILIKCRIKDVNIEIIEYKYDGHVPVFVAKKGNTKIYVDELEDAKNLFWIWVNENMKLL